jgi:hypothetical protein
VALHQNVRTLYGKTMGDFFEECFAKTKDITLSDCNGSYNDVFKLHVQRLIEDKYLADESATYKEMGYKHIDMDTDSSNVDFTFLKTSQTENLQRLCMKMFYGIFSYNYNDESTDYLYDRDGLLVSITERGAEEILKGVTNMWLIANPILCEAKTIAVTPRPSRPINKPAVNEAMKVMKTWYNAQLCGGGNYDIDKQFPLKGDAMRKYKFKRFSPTFADMYLKFMEAKMKYHFKRGRLRNQGT